MANESTIPTVSHSRQEDAPIETDGNAGMKNTHSESQYLAPPIASVEIRGMRIHIISREQTVKHLIQSSLQNIGGWVVTPNLDILRRHTRSASFRNLVASATLSVADGMPLVWASRVMGQPLPERVNGTDLMVDVCEAAAAAGRSVFFLGGNSGSAEKTIDSMTDRFNDLKIAGHHCPEFGFENRIENVAEIANILSKAKPDIVFVGLGSPKQDVLINMLRLTSPKVWWLGIGISFSFIAGDLPRAPEWAKKCGLEWLYRLISEPKRLFRRYLVQGLPFFTATLLMAGLVRFLGRKP